MLTERAKGIKFGTVKIFLLVVSNMAVMLKMEQEVA